MCDAWPQSCATVGQASEVPRRRRFHGAGRQRFRRPIEFLPHNNRMLDATKIPFPGDLDQAGYVIFSVNAIFG